MNFSTSMSAVGKMKTETFTSLHCAPLGWKLRVNYCITYPVDIIAVLRVIIRRPMAKLPAATPVTVFLKGIIQSVKTVLSLYAMDRLTVSGNVSTRITGCRYLYTPVGALFAITNIQALQSPQVKNSRAPARHVKCRCSAIIIIFFGSKSPADKSRFTEFPPPVLLSCAYRQYL